VTRVEYLVVGAGVTGLSFANWIGDADWLVLEAEAEPGGYLRSIHKDGFIWDYSGHYFHFRDPRMEAWMRARLPADELRTVVKRAFIRYRGKDIDFPFQKNIHQLAPEEFEDCKRTLASRAEDFGTAPPESFKELLFKHYGRGIAERFLVPYNEKLYACDLATLDADAMSRFFPHAREVEILENARRPNNQSYNSTFLYPKGGAARYVDALLRDLPKHRIALGERVLSIDTEKRRIKTSRRDIEYGTLISSMPLPRLLDACALPYDRQALTSSKVLVFNLGFDKKGARDVHWIYFPDRERRFYRVGFYDNIHDQDRMSLYVEIGAPADARLSEADELDRVLADLRRESIVSDQRLTSSHSVVLDPAYVHLTPAGRKEVARVMPILQTAGVLSVGRYGSWTYCSIEDNMLESLEIATTLTGSSRD
jgi:protoporphyrinogen oxidase